MRGAGLIVLLALAVATQPALAQKTKTKPSAEASVIEALEVCETFAKGDVMALERATESGWDAYDQTSESPFLKSYAASKDVRGFGYADLFSLVESYPERTLGYRRIDVSDPAGDGAEAIAAIAGLDRFDGEVRATDEGTFVSLSGENSLLLTHWDEYTFVIQLTILTPKGASASE